VPGAGRWVLSPIPTDGLTDDGGRWQVNYFARKTFGFFISSNAIAVIGLM